MFAQIELDLTNICYTMAAKLCLSDRVMTDPSQPPNSEWMDGFKKKSKELVFGLGFPGLFGGLSIHFFTEGQDRKAIIFLIIALALVVLSWFWNKLSPSIDKLSDWIISQTRKARRTVVVVSHCQLQAKVLSAAYFPMRDYRTQGLKTKGAVPLNLEKVFVPLRIGPESIGQISSNMLKAKAR